MTEPNSLEHYGVLGMKWGVRKSDRPTKDERLKTKRLKREVSAAKRNLRWKGETYAESELALQNAKSNFAADYSKISLSRKNRIARMREASEKLSEIFKSTEVPKAEMERAREIYNDAANAMWKHTNEMVEKYGKTKVKELKTKTMVYGGTDTKVFADEVLKTGITIANIPFYGQMYTGRYIAEKEYDKRVKLMTDQAKKRY